ncbi:MAG: hypothetical protein LBV74_08670 [Tannerella sp.]|jgi:hypothetical protein|nr:hypothetical protein [Tannerella sp.]
MAEYGYKAYLEVGRLSEQGDYCSYTALPLELDGWSYTFIRGIDDRGKVSTGLRGGNISFLISGIPRLLFWEWATETCKYLSGNIIIRNTEGYKINQLHFEDAACVSMKVKYLNEGKAYMSTEVVLQAEKLYFEGASKPLDNRWPENALYKIRTLGASATDDLDNLIKSLLGKNLSAITPVVPLEGVFEIEGHPYEIAQFEISFLQDVTFNGRPNSQSKGGIATVGLYQLPDNYLNNWMVNTVKKSGEICFGSELEGYGLNIRYTDAFCMGCHAGTDNYSDASCVFRFNILPQTLIIKDIMFETPYFL